MNASARELALRNAKIIAMLPLEEWIDEACRESDLKLTRVLRAMLEVKRAVEEQKL